MFKFAKQKNTGSVEYLIVGLGNPGKKYETTRHNAGFMCIDKISAQERIDVKKVKFHALIGDGYIDSHKVILMKPQTMMNNSGQAIKECADFYKIPVENIIVIYEKLYYKKITFDPSNTFRNIANKFCNNTTWNNMI